MSESRVVDPILAAHPAEILEALDGVFSGQKWLAWDPETVLLSLKEEISDASVDKLLAVQAVASNPKGLLITRTLLKKL